MDDLQGCKLSKKIILQMAIKAINNIAKPNSLIPTLLVFGAYLHMSKFDAFIPTITQRSAAIKSAIKKVQKVKAEKQIANVLNQKMDLFQWYLLCMIYL